MSLNGIASAALSALQTNSTALRVVSNNVANLNTQGYVRRVVNQQTLSNGGALGGVQVSGIERIVDNFLTAEQTAAQSGSARYDTQSTIFSQINGFLGSPGDSSSLTSRLNAVSTALGQAALSPASSANQVSTLNSLQNLASTVSNLSSQVSTLRNQVDQQVGTSISGVNSLIKQIYDLNTQVRTAKLGSDDSSALLDQRDVAVQNLAQLIGVRSAELPDGRLTVMTEDGVSLVSDSYAQFSYTPGSNNGTYGAITVQDISGQSGNPIAAPQNFESHLGSGKLKGLLDMRDGTLSGLAQEIGNLARNTALAYNTAHNAGTSYPPPTSLTGRNTGLVSGDALGFSGKTTLAVADASGNLVSRIDIDFGAGTLSVDGGAPASIGSTVGSFATALNSALGTNGSASFNNGVLSVAANGGNGLAVQDDATTPASRGGSGFSQFFGLNDLFRGAAPSILATGLSGSDASGFAAGSQISLQLKGPNGEAGRSATVTLTAGMTMANIVTALNTAMGGAVSFSLGSDGALTATPSVSNANYALNVTGDTTQRGSTGMSFTQLFGVGTNQMALQASNFSVNAAIVAAPSRLAFARPQIGATTVAGDAIIGHGDNSGAVALQNVGSASQSFAKAGGMAAEVASLGDYAAAFYQDVATRGAAADANRTAQQDRLQEAQTRLSATSGVNLDEELTHMMSYQQAYSAGARMLSVVQQLFDTLLQIQ